MIYFFNLGSSGGGGGSGDIINADRVIKRLQDGQNIGNSSMTIPAFLSALIYDSLDPVVNSFTGGQSLEKGESTLAYNLSYNVSEPTDSTTIASIVITSNQGYDSGDIKTGTGDQSGTHAINLTSDTNETFTITVTSSAGKTGTATTVFAFYNRIYMGVAAAGTYNEAFIKALASNALDSNYMHDFSVNAGASEYIFYAIPKAYVSSPYLSPPYFFLGTALPGGMSVESSTISYTHEGNTEDYILYKSDNPNLGATDVQVKSTPS